MLEGRVSRGKEERAKIRVRKKEEEKMEGSERVEKKCYLKKMRKGQLESERAWIKRRKERKEDKRNKKKKRTA